MSLPTTTHQFFFPKLALQVVPLTAPRANKVLIKMYAFWNLMVTWSVYPGLSPNLVPCLDIAGEVIAIDVDVTWWRVSDRVSVNFMLNKLPAEQTATIAASILGGASHSVMTEYKMFPSLVAIPSHLSYEEASTLPYTAVTAYSSLVSGWEPLRAGDTVLVMSTGHVLIFALQFAVASGTTQKTVPKFGLKYPNWDEEVLRLTEGQGAVHVIKDVGNTTLPRSISAVKFGGSMNIIGFLGNIADVGPPDIVIPVIQKGLKIRSISVGLVKEYVFFIIPPPTQYLSVPVQILVIDKVFSFEEAKAVYVYLELQAHVDKVVIQF
ncbi:zinc-binding alcohol dehydrogenase [Mycena vulgaris]|nr:zinc-binding alcohol dehydrogenase [Mycena vulgaris]